MDYYQRACELKGETIASRRYFHANAEVGLNCDKAKAYVMEKLADYGIEPRDCGHGVVATIGAGSPVILLRADMDALPMPEESGEPFACPDGKHAHACGHDFHAAMLLAAARMLKETEGDLKGTVKLMFQPAEETFEGAKDMIAAGVLEDPRPDVALAYHVTPGQMPVGIFMYNDKNTMMYSVDGFRIEVKGKGSHGAYPQRSIDPVNAAVHIYLALEAIMAREIDPTAAAVMTVGKFDAGTAANIIPNTAVLEGTIRANDKDARNGGAVPAIPGSRPAASRKEASRADRLRLHDPLGRHVRPRVRDPHRADPREHRRHGPRAHPKRCERRVHHRGGRDARQLFARSHRHPPKDGGEAGLSRPRRNAKCLLANKRRLRL